MAGMYAVQKHYLIAVTQIFLDVLVRSHKRFLRLGVRLGRYAAGLVESEVMAFQPVRHAAHRIANFVRLLHISADRRDFDVKLTVQMQKQFRRLRLAQKPFRTATLRLQLARTPIILQMLANTLMADEQRLCNRFQRPVIIPK